MDYKLITSDSLIGDYKRRYHNDNDPFDESLFKAICDDTLSKIKNENISKINIVHLDIKKFKARLPKNYIRDVQAIFRLHKVENYRYGYISQMIQSIPGSECNLEINVKCPACHQLECNCGKVIAEIDVDYMWRMSNPEYIAAASRFFHDYANPTKPSLNNWFDNSWYLMTRTVNNWFATNYYLGECKNIKADTNIEYKVVNGEIITNFEEGEVILVYFGENLDKDGYKLVPDNTRVIEAIYSSVAHATMAKKFYTQLTPDTRLAYQMLSQEMEIKIKRASGELDFPEVTEMVSLIQNDFRRLFDPQWWYRGGNKVPDSYNPSNNYNYKGKY